MCAAALQSTSDSAGDRGHLFIACAPRAVMAVPAAMGIRNAKPSRQHGRPVATQEIRKHTKPTVPRPLPSLA